MSDADVLDTLTELGFRREKLVGGRMSDKLANMIGAPKKYGVRSHVDEDWGAGGPGGGSGGGGDGGDGGDGGRPGVGGGAGGGGARWQGASFSTDQLNLDLGYTKVVLGKNMAAISESNEDGGGEVVLCFGIIDILQTYRMRKKVEHFFKSMVHDGHAVSVTDQQRYADRFREFLMTKVFAPAQNN